MVEKKKIRFCIFCGIMLKEYEEGYINHCHHCGMRLPYNLNTDRNKEKIL